VRTSEIAGVVLPADVLGSRQRGELASVAAGVSGQIDPGGPARTVAFWGSVVVWFPVAWSGTKGVAETVPQQAAVLALAAAVYGVLALAASFARSNALAVLRRDQVARSRLSDPERAALLERDQQVDGLRQGPPSG
jgi:hypothetical protein